MSKWHLSSAIGTGRPPPLRIQDRSFLLLHPRHFHSSRPCKAEESSTQTPNPRTKRRADASADLQKLYKQSNATATTAANAPAQGVDARSLAAALKPGAIRYTGRRPPGTPLGEGQRERRPMQNHPQRTGGQGGQGRQESDREQGYRVFTTRGYDNGQRLFQGAGGTTSTPRFSSVRQAAGSRDHRSGLGRGMGGRFQGGDKNRKRRSSSSFNRDEDQTSSAEMKAQELEIKAYEQEKAEKRAPKPVAFEPTAATIRASVEGAGPAFVSGVTGMKEVLKEKLEWVAERRQWVEGRAAWGSDRQRRDMLDIVEQLKAGDEGQQQLLKKLLSGGYLAQHPALQGARKQDTLTQCEITTAQNESYEPSDQKSLLEKVRSLVAATPSRAGGKQGTRQSVKA